MRKYNFVGVGTPSVDVIYTENGIVKRFGGGAVITTCIALAKWGMKSAIISRIGRDNYGGWLLRNFREEGVDVSVLLEDSNPTSVWSISTTMEKREVLTPDTYVPLEKLNSRQKKTIQEADAVMIRLNNMLFKDVVALAKKANARLFVTFHLFEFDADFIGFLRKNEPELVFMTKCEYESAIEKINMFDMNSFFVIMKGEEGCSIFNKGNMTSYHGFRSNPVDYSGANDSFVAGFVYGYLNGWPMNKTAKFANTLCAMATTEYGGRRKVPTNEEKETIIKYAESMKG